MSTNITRLPALSPRQEFGGRSSGPRGGGPGSPLAQANGNPDMDAVMEDAGLRAENSDLGPRLSHPPREPLPPRAESTPPDRDLPERKAMGIDVPAWPSGNKRGARGGGSGMWSIHEGTPSQLKTHSPFFTDPQKDSARSYLWAHRSAAHATFKGRAAAGDGNLHPSANGKRLDDRLSRSNSPIPGATAWTGAPGGVGEQDGAPLEWKELQHAAAMASAQMMHEAPNAALTQIEISPGQKGSLSPEHLKQMHGMSETDIQRLYRAMRIYTLGFHEMMQDICSTAADRRGLLVKVWRLFGRLWDSSLQVVFDSEVLALGADRERALQQVTFLQRELEAVNDENRLIRGKVNEMVNHALTRSHQDQTSMENTTVLQSELNKAKKINEESAQQMEHDARKIKQLEEEMHRVKKALYKAEAQVKAKADELSIVQVSLSTTRHSDDEIRQQLKSEEARANRAEEAAAEAEIVRAAMQEEKELAVKISNVARHDMFEERRAKRILQVDVEYVRGEIIERRQEAKDLASQIKAYADAKQEAEDHLRHVIAWRQKETDRAETYERDIQALVVMFNHMQDEVVLNDDLKQEVQKYKSLLEEKRAKKRKWKEHCEDARKVVAELKQETAEADAIREEQQRRHAQEVANLVLDVQQLEATNAELHDRLKPLRVEVADMKQRMAQLQLARTSAKMRLEAANKRTAKLVDALSENIRILGEERDRAHRLGQELKAEREITEMQKADMAFLKEEQVAEVAKLRGEIKKAENEGNKVESQLEYVRQQALETGSDLGQQIQELNDGLMESLRERDAAEEHLALKQHHLEVANKKIEELDAEIQAGKAQIKEAYTLQIELDYSKKSCEKYKGWLQATNIGVKEMMQLFKDFLEKEPLAPIGEERAWNGVAEGTLGSVLGNEYETEALVVDLDNNWDFLLQEKTRLMDVLNEIKTDRDMLKDELNGYLVQWEDKEMEMQNTISKIRKDIEVLNHENAKIREHSTSLTVKISNITNDKTALEEKLGAQAEQLRGTEAEVAALKAFQEKSKKLDHISEELEKSETQRKLLIDEVEKAKQEAMQLASYEQKVENLNDKVERLDVDLNESKQLVKHKSAQVLQLEGEIANKKAKERDGEAVLAELTNVKTQLEEVNAALAAKEKELIKTQAAASESAGYIAEALRAELDSLGATTTQKIEELTQQLKEKDEAASVSAARISELETAGMTEEAKELMQRQYSIEKEHLSQMHREQTEALTASLKAEMDQLKAKISSESPEAADVERLEEELEDMKEAKEAAYRNLVKADDEMAELQQKVFVLEEKLTEQSDAVPDHNEDPTKPGSAAKIKDEMAAEVRSVVERLAVATLKPNDQLVSSVWCSSMMQHAESETILTDMMWTAASLEKMISKIYCEKIEADLHDHETGEHVQTMQEFVYDYFMQKTGIRAMGEVHLSRLIASIEASLHSSSRVNMFGALVGHPSCKDWPKSSETVFISVLSQIFSKAGGVPNTEATEGRSDIERTVLQDAAAAALPAMPWNNIEQKLIAAGGGGTFVDLDKAMGIIMDTWLEQKKAEEDRAGAIFAKFDRTKDSLMPQSDFKRLMASLEGDGATAERVQEVFDKLLKESAGMANDLIPGPVFRTAAWPIGIAGGSGYCKVEPPAALVAPVAFPEGMIFLSDIVPTIGKVVDEICESLKDTKSVAEELDNMRKLFGLVSNAANSQASGNEVWNPYRRFILLLHISHSRKMVLLHESRAEQGVAGFNTKFGK